ncbi:unnamed protein product [Rotaria sordida]|uniref:Uncharacterized protein n=1 Tax=Rotaria sordida TaxID=392033 RepID=A0A818Z147_9BILA|nr:unnamed protein product [Rotaria sordida]
MWDEFYVKRAVEKEAVHDTDLELFAIQKARELKWDNFIVKDATKLSLELLQLEKFALWKMLKTGLKIKDL